jgi:hypothetical protein
MSEQLINEYILEIAQMTSPSTFESRRRTLDLCYSIRLECTRTTTLTKSYQNELKAVVSLIKTLKGNAHTIIEE